MMALIEKERSRFIGSAQSVLIDRVSETITGVTTFFVASCGYPQRVAPQRCPPQFRGFSRDDFCPNFPVAS